MGRYKRPRAAQRPRRQQRQDRRRLRDLTAWANLPDLYRRAVQHFLLTEDSEGRIGKGHYDPELLDIVLYDLYNTPEQVAILHREMQAITDRYQLQGYPTSGPFANYRFANVGV